MAPRPGLKLLDVAGGTGDISFRVLDRLKGAGSATICDMTAPMLVEGRKRAEAENLAHALDWVCGDAMKLPFPDKSFDAYTIAFGIRNVTRIADALAEAYRVLKPGGRALILEFSTPRSACLSKLYDGYSFNIIPKLGRWIADDEASYQYLVESIRMHPDQETLKAMMLSAGFASCHYHNFTGGIVACHQGVKD